MRLVTPPQSRQEEGTHHSQPLTSLLSHPHPHSTSAGFGLYLPLHWQNSTHETLGAIIPSLHKITSSFPFPPGSSHTTELQPHSSLSCGAAPSNSHTWQPAGPLAFLQQCPVCNHPLLHTSHQRPALCQSGILGAGLTGALIQHCLRHIFPWSLWVTHRGLGHCSLCSGVRQEPSDTTFCAHHGHAVSSSKPKA